MQPYKLLNLFFLFLVLQLISCERDHTINADQTVVIIKADDLGNITPNWQRFISMTIDNNIASSIGVISNNMTEKATIEKVKEWSVLKNVKGESNFEFWDHGYDHSNTNNIYEFNGTDLASQIDDLKRSQNFFKDSLGLICSTFSAPYNQSSNVTFEALKLFPEIKIWICYQRIEKQSHSSWINPNFSSVKYKQSHILLDIKVEAVYHIPINSVKSFFNANKFAPYLVIQIHPNAWTDNDFSDFQTLIDFLKTKHVIFMTPVQYFNYLTNEKN